MHYTANCPSSCASFCHDAFMSELVKTQNFLLCVQESNTNGQNVPSNQMYDHSFFLPRPLCSQLPFLCSRAVQLGSLYVRGLSHLLGANCASGRPLPNAALMPWHSFDGRLFHSKYLLAHSGADNAALLEGDVSEREPTELFWTVGLVFTCDAQRAEICWPELCCCPLSHPQASCLSLFLCLRGNLVEACRTRGRDLQSRPDPQGRRAAAEFSDRETHAGETQRHGPLWPRCSRAAPLPLQLPRPSVGH